MTERVEELHTGGVDSYNPLLMAYLIENNECERTFLSRLGWSWDALEPVLRSLDIHPHCCWALIEVDMSDLASSVKGDVDLLIGRVAFKNPQRFEERLKEYLSSLDSLPPNALIQFMAADNLVADLLTGEGELIWPPKPDYLVGIEVKCSSLSIGVNPLRTPIGVDNMKSTKASPQKTRKIRLQIEKLMSLGCDRVALLDLIANPPADGINMGAWHNASVIALRTEDAMQSVLATRLPPDCAGAHWVYSVGAVAGGDETVRGSGLPQQYREAQPIDRSLMSGAPRTELSGAILDILSKVSPPYFLPAVYMNCRLCKRIHHARSEGCPITISRFSAAPHLE
jgi:hypothetical protein